MAAEERTTTTTKDRQGNTHTTTRVVLQDRQGGGGGAAKWALLVVLVAVLGFGASGLTRDNAAEIAKDNAVADAAGQVGKAAQSAGDAIEGAAAGVSNSE